LTAENGIYRLQKVGFTRLSKPVGWMAGVCGVEGGKVKSTAIRRFIEIISGWEAARQATLGWVVDLNQDRISGFTPWAIFLSCQPVLPVKFLFANSQPMAFAAGMVTLTGRPERPFAIL